MRRVDDALLREELELLAHRFRSTPGVLRNQMLRQVTALFHSEDQVEGTEIAP
jgi:hypothetical protein